jgi:hypothetical protein
MDYQPWIGPLALVVAIYGAYHQTRQTRVMEAQSLPRAARRRGELPHVSWLRSPAILALVALALLAWAPWIITKYNPTPVTNKVFGEYKLQINPATGTYAGMTLFMAFNSYGIRSYKNSGKIIGIAFHNYGYKDIDDISELQKSAPYDIKSEQQLLLINTNSAFVDEVNRGSKETFYGIVIIPNSAAADSFTTMRQAKAMGAIIEQIGVGPP